MKYILSLFLRISAMIYKNRPYLLFYTNLCGFKPIFNKDIASNLNFGYTSDVDLLINIFRYKSKKK